MAMLANSTLADASQILANPVLWALIAAQIAMAASTSSSITRSPSGSPGSRTGRKNFVCMRRETRSTPSCSACSDGCSRMACSHTC